MQELVDRPIATAGKIVVDELLLCSQAPVPGGHTTVTRRITAGGAGANVAGNLAAHGTYARIVGWSGDDLLSSVVTDQLAGLGVDLRLVRRGIAPIATVLAWSGDRSFLVDQGTLRAHSEDIDPTWFDGIGLLHINGFELLDHSWPDVTAQLAAAARERGIAITVDCPTANRITGNAATSLLDRIAALEPAVLFCNELEFEALGLAGCPGWTGQVVVHAGIEPTIVYRQAETESFPVSHVVAEPETTGCGDAFAAGFLAAATSGSDLPEVIETAHRWAAEIAATVGAAPSVV